MRIEKSRYVNINLVDCDVDAMRHIIELACAHLKGTDTQATMISDGIGAIGMFLRYSHTRDCGNHSTAPDRGT